MGKEAQKGEFDESMNMKECITYTPENSKMKCTNNSTMRGGKGVVRRSKRWGESNESTLFGYIRRAQ
jgi:hypothetical protein